MKKITLLLFTFLISNFGFASANIVLHDFTQADSVLNKNVASISDDGKTLNFDTTKIKNRGWHWLMFMPKGKFENGKSYTIFMKINVRKASSKGFMHMLVRNGHVGGNEVMICNQNLTNGENNLILRFTASDDKGFNMQFIAHDEIEGYVTDFKIVEGDASTYVPITKNKKPYKLDMTKMPKGAKEFEVEQPQNFSGEIVEAKRFGITPDADNLRMKFAKAIEYCKKNGAAKLVLEKNATYKITEDGSILFDGLKNFVFDGNGSTFQYNRTHGLNFVIRNCERSKFCNFNIDWDWEKNPLASIVRVKDIYFKKSDEKNAYVDYEFVDYKKFVHSGYVRAAVLSCWDIKEKSVGIENGLTMSYEFFKGKQKPKTEWVSDNVLRIYGVQGFNKSLKVGQYYRMQHYYYDGGAFTITSNKHFTMENINIFSAIGNGILITGTQKYTLLKGVKIVIPNDNLKRVITTTADHMHVAQSCGYIKIEDCEFSQGADDCINFHDTSSYGVRNASNSLISRHNYAHDGAVIEFRNPDYSPTGFVAVRKSVKALSDGRFEIFFDKNLPTTKDGRFIIFNKTYDTHNIIVRNSYFHSNRARGILVLARDVTIENCRFRRNEMGALKFETGYTTNIWCEGYGVRNVLIRNNIFDSVNPLGVSNFGYERDIFIGAYLQSDPSEAQTDYPIIKDVFFDRNTFKDTFGMVATIASAGDVTFYKNTFINDTPRNIPKYYRSSFYLKNASDIKIINNMFIKSSNLDKIGVYYDKDTVKNLTIQGNEILQNIKL